jgi:hypothetical protein
MYIKINNFNTNEKGESYQINDPQGILMTCTHIPIIFDLHQHNIQLDSLDFDDAKGSTLTLQQETLCSLAIHSCQVASQLLPT